MIGGVDSPWTIAGWGTAIVAIVGFFSLLIRQIGPWRKQISDAEHRIREALEAALEKERAAHNSDLERERLARASEARSYELERDEMRDRIARLEQTARRRDKMRDAERAMERHRFNNLDQCFQSLLLLLKANPDKVPEAITMVEEMRATQLRAEAEEKAILQAAAIKAAGHDDFEEEGGGK